MSLYDKLLRAGGRESTYQSRYDYKVVECKGNTFYFNVYEETDMDDNVEQSVDLVEVTLGSASSLALQTSSIFGTGSASSTTKKYKAANHVKVFNNAVLFRESGLSDQHARIFLRKFENKYLLTPEDIKQFEAEGFKLLINI